MLTGVKGSEIMVKRKIQISIDEEEPGVCNMLISKQFVKLKRCKNDTPGNWAMYCRDHWDALVEYLNHDYELAKCFPPIVEGKPSRWAHALDDKEFKLLSEDYYNDIVAPPHAIYVGSVKDNPKWNDKDTDDYFVYLIRCNDGSLYVGQTRGDPLKRIEEHITESGNAAKWIIDHGFCNLVQILCTVNRKSALELEKALYKMFRSAGNRISMGSLEDD
jgi:predicted GIY-YIG superfamily endonuclease